MNTLFGLRNNRKLTALTAVAGAAFIGVSAFGATAASAAPASETAITTAHTSQVAQAPEIKEQALLRGSTKGSYFWDDASGRQGDTGMPAIGKPMQKGLFSSPSWPLGTEGYVIYKGKKAKFFIGDRGPGIPSERGVMLDIDGKTFAELTGGKWNTNTLTVESNGGAGHIEIDYVVTKWGDGPGTKGAPLPFSSGAWRS
ncbi:hypothetical protein [Microtetraspora glauca]|uniref:Uncharacterized protein n=1 Tax=Microtetraspora glauca TaxID=1996 RepID=A0ABV3GFM9_MICGL